MPKLIAPRATGGESESAEYRNREKKFRKSTEYFKQTKTPDSPKEFAAKQLKADTIVEALNHLSQSIYRNNLLAQEITDALRGSCGVDDEADKATPLGSLLQEIVKMTESANQTNNILVSVRNEIGGRE